MIDTEAFDNLCDACHDLAVAWCMDRPELIGRFGQRLDPLLAELLPVRLAAENVLDALRPVPVPAAEAVLEHYQLDSELHPLGSHGLFHGATAR
jgi:hypothetical protein